MNPRVAKGAKRINRGALKYVTRISSEFCLLSSNFHRKFTPNLKHAFSPTSSGAVGYSAYVYSCAQFKQTYLTAIEQAWHQLMRSNRLSKFKALERNGG